MVDRDRAENQSQDQTQSPATAVTVNFRTSGDPTLENQILNGDYGVGRQLGMLAGVVEVLLASHEQAALPVGAANAIAKFKKAQADIGRIKRTREAARLVECLARPGLSPAAAQSLCGELRSWLEAYALDLTSQGSFDHGDQSRDY